jgi:5-(carboxyamino)imidazole ribonucleotide synthase
VPQRDNVVTSSRTGVATVTAGSAVGIVGGGQLARMTLQAADALGLEVTVLAEHPTDSAAASAARLLIGTPTTPEAMIQLADQCGVVTFDHEQVDLGILEDLERRGHLVRPGSRTLQIAVDKAAMRQRFAEAGIAVPRFAPLGQGGTDSERALAGIATFADEHGWPVVLKAVRGGYDGKGVWPVADRRAAERVCRNAHQHGTALLVEEAVEITAELAVLVARRPDGRRVAWPVVRTVQQVGICREVLLPAGLPPDVESAATALALEVADEIDSVGVLAVELFWAGDRVLVNEVAARPHNSGHWTIDGATTSQFENHLRAVLDLPLGDPSATAAAVASVNVLGGPEGLDPRDLLAGALDVPGAHVHLYGKAARPGRKLGHVTVCGDDLDDVRGRAWDAAIALGTPAITTEGDQRS